MKLTALLVSIVVVLSVRSPLRAQEIPCETSWICPEDTPTPASSTYCMTSSFWFEAESATGAVGDVVGVTFSLHFAPDFDFEFVPGFDFGLFRDINLIVCHDPAKVELLGTPVYSEEILARNPLIIDFLEVGKRQFPRDRGHGFKNHFGVLIDRSPVVGSLPLMTVYYRLIDGTPGESSEISFCDGPILVFGPGRCNFSGISSSGIVYDVRWPLLSTGNKNGTLTVRDGPVTQPERPPEPPEATVYSEPPTSDEVNLRIRLDRVLAFPGDRDVPVEVFVTADVDYTGVILPIDFDERYVRIARVEDQFLSGTALIDNEDGVPGAQADEGFVVLASSLLGNRRMAAAGEEFHAATLYLDILESAAEVSETRLEPRPVGGRAGDPFVIVRHLSGQAAEEVEVRGEYGAVTISPGILAIRATAETPLGDANFDGTFDISDPVAVLGFLFLGDREPLCLPAADYEADGQLTISDPIRMLGVLFTGATPPSMGEVDEAPVVDCR